MKFRHRFIAFTLASALSVSSCATFMVPGETEARYEKITGEYLTLAAEYEKLNNYSKAAEYYEMAAKMDAENANLYTYKLARCYALAQNWKKARPLYEKLLEQDEGNVSIKVSLAYITAMEGDLSQATVLYTELVKENPADASLLKNLIAVLMADGKYELAEKQYYVLLQNFPNDDSLQNIRSKLNEGLKN